MHATTPTARLLLAAGAAGLAAAAVVAGAAPGQAADCGYPNVCSSVAPATNPAAAAGQPVVIPAGKTVTTSASAPGKITLPVTSFASTTLKNGSLTLTASKLKPNAPAKFGFQGTTYKFTTTSTGTLTARITPKNAKPGVSGLRLAMPTSSGKIIVTWRKITVPDAG